MSVSVFYIIFSTNTVNFTKAYWAHFRRKKNIIRELKRNFRELTRNFRKLTRNFSYIYMQKGDVSHISEAFFVKNHDMLNLYVWFQK